MISLKIELAEREFIMGDNLSGMVLLESGYEYRKTKRIS